MTWLDGVLAVPVIGVRVKVEYENIDKFDGNIGKFVNRLEKEGESMDVHAKR